jgi:DNA polymerase bacteriophage-type
MTTVHVDFETRSAVDLAKAGVHVYADDPSTDIWCMAIAVDARPVTLWTRDDCGSADVHRLLFSHIRDGATFIAHNAPFELAIWNRLMVPRYGWPVLPVEQVRCTMAMAYAMALPGSLENAAAAVGLDIGKDMEGRSLMMRMAKPRKINPDGSCVWWNEPDRLTRLYAYCKQDVEVERKLEKRLLPLSPSEQALWVLDQKINDRGIQIDTRAVENAIGVVEEAKVRLDKEMQRVTGGWVPTCSRVADLTEWLSLQGFDVDGVAKADVADLLERDDLPPMVRRALELRREAAKSSTAKLKAMTKAANIDGRVRGLHQYHGASTGRWAGRRVQTQNFPRGTMDKEDVNAVLDILNRGSL